MKKSLMAMAFLAAVSFAAASYATVARVFVAGAQFLKDLVLGGFKLAQGEGMGFARPAVALVQAKAFVLRLAKRERPELTGSWRMCPST